MHKYNSEIFKLLIKKIGSKKGVYSSIERKSRKFKAVKPEILFLLIAVEKGIKISKYIHDENILDRVGDLYSGESVSKPHSKVSKTILTKQIGKENPYDFPLSKFNLSQEIIKDCSPIFKKPYRGAIKEALLTLEDHIRKKIGSEEDGQSLIVDARDKGAFNRNKKSESEGLYFLYAGAIGWLRNPPGHRKLKYEKEEAIKIILFTDYLLKLFDQLCLKNKITSNHPPTTN